MAAEGRLLAGSVTRKAIIHAGPHLGISGRLATLEKQACQSPGSPGQRRAGALHGARPWETTEGGWSMVDTTRGIAPTHLLWGQADGNGAEDGLLPALPAVIKLLRDYNASLSNKEGERHSLAWARLL